MLVRQSDQRDTISDGFGNICDAGLDNDRRINFNDLGQMRSVFFQSDEDADLIGDGIVNFLDLSLMRSRFFGEPGPGLGACG